MIETDVKLFLSEKMNLTDDAGGRRSANVIPYGQENSIFPDISREARNRGQNRIQKVWAAVTTDDTEPYIDAVAIIARAPDDENVNVAIFATPDENGDDKLPAARNYLQQGLIAGAISDYSLYGLHNSGSAAITVWCNTNIDPPDINSTLILVEGVIEISVRIIRILANNIRVFTDAKGDFTRRVISMQISDGLSHILHGSEVTRVANGNVKIYNTIISNSTKIYGATHLTESADLGDLSITVNSLNAQVVPSNTNYIPITDINAGGEGIALQESGGAVTFTVMFSLGANVSLYLGTACMPGTLSIAVSSGVLTDDGGMVKSGAVIIGTIDYNSGIILFGSNAPTYTGNKTVTFTPSAPVQRVQNTFSINVTAANRASVYIATLMPIPAPGGLRVAYLSGGKWYTLRDRGNGSLRADDAAYGAGQVNYVTGATTITLGSLPDVYSSIIYTWSSAADTFSRADITPSKLFFDLYLVNVPANVSVMISWGEVSLESDNLGNLTGTGGMGTVFCGEKRIRIYPAHLPQMGQEITIDYGYGTASTYEDSFTPTIGQNNVVNLVLAHGNVIPGSVLLKYPVKYKKYIFNPVIGYQPAPIPIGEQEDIIGSITARDNAFGAWIGSHGAMSYGDGTLSYSVSNTARAYEAHYERKGFLSIWPVQTTPSTFVPYYQFIKWILTSSPIELINGNVTVSYRSTGDLTSITEIFTIPELQFDLTNDFAEPIVPQSVRFILGESVFADLNPGIISKDPSAQTGAGTQVATIDYQSGIATFTAWVGGVTNNPTIQTLITRLKATTASTCSFRTAGAPIQSGGLSVRVTKPDGTVLSATAGANGDIVASGIDGRVDFQVGVVNLAFGAWIMPAGHEAEPWYDVEAIREDGKIFRPEPVLIDTLTYSAVMIRYQPIDAESLGVDPTRFPPDGLMPIFRISDTVIVHHTLAITLPNPLVAGSTVNCDRTHVTWITVVDASGAAVPATGRFVLNSEVGTVTVANPLDLAGFTQPLTLYHTIADRAVITDLDIAGVITMSRTLRHNFPQGALVSSVLPLRTLQADWDTLFSQQAWLNSWSDIRQGNPILAQYNYTQFPPIVTNHHATRQRYALVWKNATQFDCTGESMGFVGSGDKNNDFSPTNLLTGGPLFTLKLQGLGSLWVAGNVLRLNTVQVAEKSIWCLMSISPSDPGGLDKFEIRVLGDINA
jgi:hypothetical protein